MSTPNIRELRQQYARRHPRKGGWSRLLFGLIGLVALYLVIGFFIAPLIIRPQIEKRLSAEIHRTVHLVGLRLNPLRLAVTAEGLSITDSKGGPFVAWKRLFVNFDLWAYFFGELRFQEISLEGFDGHISVAKDGTLNFGDLLANREKAPPASGDRPAKTLRIDRLTVTDAHLAYDDLSPGTRFSTELGPISFILRNFRTGGSSGAPGEFSATTDSGEEFHWTGTVAVAPLRSAGVFAVSKVSLKKYAPYYSGYVNFELLDGVLEASLPYNISTESSRPVVRCSDATAKLQNLKLAERGQSTPTIALGTIALYNVSGDFRPPSEPVLSIQKWVIEEGKIAVRRDAKGLNLASLLTPVAPATPPTSALVAQSPNLNLVLDELSVRNLSVSFDDLSTPRTVHQQLDQFSVTGKSLSFAHPETPFPIDITAMLSPQASIHAGGQIALQPLKAELSLEVKRVPLAPLSPYLETFLNARVANGNASLTTKFRLAAANGGLTYWAQGDATVEDFSALDGAGAEFVSWKGLAVRGLEYQSLPGKFLAAEINWKEPKGQMVIGQDQSSNLETLMREVPRRDPAGAPTVTYPTPSPAPPTEPLFIAVEKISLNGALLGLTDLSVQPNVKLTLDHLSCTITELSSAELSRPQIGLQGQVNGSGPLTVTGQMNPLNLQGVSDVKIVFKSIELAPLAPYVRKYVGHELQQGELSLDLKVRLAKSRLDSINVATLSHFDLGAPTNSADAVKLPVSIPFVLALLRDTQGRILIDLPVQGNLEDPSFHIGPVVRHVVVNLLTKVASSPFSFIGAIFGGGKGDELSYQDFEPGQTILAEEGVTKLDIVSKALRERPALHLQLEGGYDPQVDQATLREEELTKHIRAALWEENRKFDPNLGSVDQYAVSPEGEARMIRQIYKDASAPKAPDATNEKTAAPPKRPWFIFRLFARSTPSPPRATSAPPPKAEPLLSVAEMRASILKELPVEEGSSRQLAADRAQRVRQYLVEHGEIPEERILVLGTAAVGRARVNLQLK